MLDPHYRSALRTSAFAEDPLVASRRDFRPTPPARLDTTPFVRSPAQVFIDDVKDALLHGATPGKPMPPSVKSVSTPTYSRAGWALFEDDTLRVQVQTGPLLWLHTARGSDAGRLVDTWA
jgi:hypothetical protein